MSKAHFGEYSAFETPGGIRYQKHKKMVSKDLVPPEVVNYLSKKLGQPIENIQPPEESKAPIPSEEEKAQLREESLEVPEHLRLDPDAPEPTPLTAEDFDESVTEEIIEETAEGVTDKVDTGEPENEPDDVNEKTLPLGNSEYLDAISVHTAPLETLVEALHQRFGIYTVYLRQLPQGDEINPLTGELFTKYHLGIAYQAAVRAQHQGTLDTDPEMNRRQIDESREASQTFKDKFVPVAETIGQARQQNSFAYRTSVAGNRKVSPTEIVHEQGLDGKVRAVQREIPPEERGSLNGATSVIHPEEDEPLVKPKMGGKPVIRPDW